MSKDLTWKVAIKKVLKEAEEPLHYAKVAELIVEKEYRASVGATPARTVHRDLQNLIKEKNSGIIKITEGVFASNLISKKNIETEEKNSVKLDQDSNNIISSFGVFWERDRILWKSNPDIYGIQQIGAIPVNFKKQIGIYLLYDNREIVYAGQAIKQSLGQRLFQHTKDRLSGRWNRFSWFGFYNMNDDGILQIGDNLGKLYNWDILGDTLEAILIESIEPRQNRKQGNLFSGIDYIQETDRELKKKLYKSLGEDLIE
jgi:hypothetical protein